MTLLVGQGVLDVLSSNLLVDVAKAGRHLDTAGPALSLLTVALALVALGSRTRLAWRALVAAFGMQLGVAAVHTVALVLLHGDGWAKDAAIAGAALLSFAVAPTVGLFLTASEPVRRWYDRTSRDAEPADVPDDVPDDVPEAPASRRDDVPVPHADDIPLPRPAVAACVLAGSLAALTTAGALFTALATSSFAAMGDELYDLGVVIVLWELACPVPLVVGAVLLFHGLDRRVLVVAAGLVVGIAGWWLWLGASGALGAGGEQVLLPVLLFAGPAVAVVVLAFRPSVTRRLEAR
ncbi:hypothetical protein OF117_20130 [Geodermatophilus sp. YIM 151500]|uniref:hypothetical protein n=1 Tax=Geodermatophilus sp. YIM 151500 TaxID=2984531 RepID=UPI0021E462FC|nr:hypothetical protein [Geodermatophilus sp. YIM 151500]MCV2491659.1 hypothetical protein [Geodermatophilus sp. YIM 151500]